MFWVIGCSQSVLLPRPGTVDLLAILERTARTAGCFRFARGGRLQRGTIFCALGGRQDTGQTGDRAGRGKSRTSFAQSRSIGAKELCNRERLEKRHRESKL